MDAERKQRTGILLIFLIVLGYITFYPPFESQDSSNDSDKSTDQKNNKSADKKKEKTFLDELRTQALEQSSFDPTKSAFTLENDDICCVLSPKGAQIRQVTQKKFNGYGTQKLVSPWDNNSYDNLSGLIPKGKDSKHAVNVSELDFKQLSGTDKNTITFSYQNPEQSAESLKVSYRLVKKNGASIIERDIIAGNGWKADSTVKRQIYRAVPQQEIHRISSLGKVHCYHEENGSWNYQTKGQTERQNIGNAKWVSFIESSFLTGLIFPQAAGNINIGIAEIKPPVKGDKNSERPDLPEETLKEMGVEISIPTAQLQKGYKTGYYFGPNTPEALAAVDQHYKESKLNFKNNYYYGPRGFASINKYILYPSFNYLVGKTGSPVSALILFLLILALFSFFFVYKSYIATIQRKAVKPFVDVMKAKGGDNIRMQESQFYKKVGINPLGAFFIAFFNLFLFIGMFNLLNYSIHFRHQKFLWIKDLSSFDATLILPLAIPAWGQHISLLGLLTFGLTLLLSYWDKYKERLNNPLAAQQAKATKERNSADNPFQIPKPLQYVLKVMPLMILNNRTAAITLFRLFSIITERMQKLICSLRVNERQLTQDFTEKAKNVAVELEQTNTNSRVMSRLEQRIAKKKR